MAVQPFQGPDQIEPASGIGASKPKPPKVAPSFGAKGSAGGGAAGTAATFASTSSTTPGGGTAGKRRSVDELFLGGLRVEGGATVEITGMGPEVDKQKGAGKSASKIKIKGFKDPQIAIEVRAWKRSQLDALCDLLRPHVTPLAPIGPNAKKDPAPVEIGHWKTDVWSITHMVIEDVDGPTVTPQQQWGIKIKGQRFVIPPKRAFGIGFTMKSPAIQQAFQVQAKLNAQLQSIVQNTQFQQQAFNHSQQNKGFFGSQTGGGLWGNPSANVGGPF